jgi:hypothetical protein
MLILRFAILGLIGSTMSLLGAPFMPTQCSGGEGGSLSVPVWGTVRGRRSARLHLQGLCRLQRRYTQVQSRLLRL